MKIGLSGLHTGRGADGPNLVETARRVEDLGFESLWTPEHAVVPKSYAPKYQFAPAGRIANPTGARPSPLVWLAYASAATTRLRLGTGVLLLALRNPVLLAKDIATLDRLSGGRLMLGIGLGWMREEFDALGSTWDDRVARTEEYVNVLRTLWQPGAAQFSGAFVKFGPLYCNPTPLRPSGVPILIAGHSEAAARRAGRIGDGFFPLPRQNDDLVRLIALMREEAESVGRDPSAIEITTQGPIDADLMARMEALGVARYVIYADPDIVSDGRRMRDLCATAARWMED